MSLVFSMQNREETNLRNIILLNINCLLFFSKNPVTFYYSYILIRWFILYYYNSIMRDLVSAKLINLLFYKWTRLFNNRFYQVNQLFWIAELKESPYYPVYRNVSGKKLLDSRKKDKSVFMLLIIGKNLNLLLRSVTIKVIKSTALSICEVTCSCENTVGK